MTITLDVFVKATTGDILISCAELIMYRCPLCMSLFTKEVIKEHLAVHHRLEVK